MEKELVVSSTPTQVEIALLENRKLVEIHREKTNNNFTVGDIFLGSIKKLMPGLNAAFVDIGHRKDAFLHYTDLGPQIKSLMKFTHQARKGISNSHLLDNFKPEPDNTKHGKIENVFKRNYSVLVQVLKEPISTKGPRLSCEITIPGRYLVLTPFSEAIAISKKISTPEERARLKKLTESIKPKRFGLIVRTAAEGKKVADLHEELTELVNKWKSLYDQLRKAHGPMKLLSELDKTSSILRDVLNDSFNKILVNDSEVYKNIKDFLTSIAPEKSRIVSLYKGKKPIFEDFGVSKQIKSSFGKTATMHSGAYLVIEHTEAMHVIDVNSGPKMKKLDQETAALNVNMEAAAEIARQLRLRDIGGLIIIDFIDMRNSGNKSRLMKEMRDQMKSDRAQHTILALSKFGLMQITRQRVRPEVKINTAENCPMCDGTGEVNPTILITDDIERDLDFIFQSRPKARIKLHTHPFVYAYLKLGLWNKQRQWRFKYMAPIKVTSDMDLSLNQYKFYDRNNDEIRLK